MQIRDIMTRNVDSITPDTPIHQIARKMRDDDVGSLPVVEDGRILGMVTDRDIVVRGIAESGVDATEKTAEKVMTKEVLTCREDQSLEDLEREMQSSNVRRIVVTDDEDRLVGIVSLGDLARHAEGKAGATLRDTAQAP